MISVTVVGGPDDGIEVVVEGDRVHMIELADPSAAAPPPDSPIGASVHHIIMPVRLTRNGYRCYWSERAR
jgi:hypothetical protein